MNLYIRKHTFSEEFGSEYFFKFLSILENDNVSSDLVTKIVNFFEIGNAFKGQTVETFHPYKGSTVITYAVPNTDYGFTMIGFVEHEDYKNIFLNLSLRNNVIEATLDLYQELGWSLSPTRKVVVDAGDYNPETEKYENINFTFEEIENMYNSVDDLTDE